MSQPRGTAKTLATSGTFRYHERAMHIVPGVSTAAFLLWVAVILPLASWSAHRRIRAGKPLPAVRKRFLGAILSLLITAALAIFAGMESRIVLPTQFSGIGTFLAFVYFAVLVYGIRRNLRRKPELLERQRRLFGPRTPADLTLALLTALCAGILEEIAYRGVLFMLVNRAAGTAIALIVAAIVFGAAHFAQGRRSVLFVTLLGVVFQVLALISTSLLPSMLLHTLYDAAIFVLLYRSCHSTPAQSLAQSPATPMA